MAQLGRALDWGSRGRRFKSCQPDDLCLRTSARGERGPALTGEPRARRTQAAGTLTLCAAVAVGAVVLSDLAARRLLLPAVVLEIVGGIRTGLTSSASRTTTPSCRRSYSRTALRSAITQRPSRNVRRSTHRAPVVHPPSEIRAPRSPRPPRARRRPPAPTWSPVTCMVPHSWRPRSRCAARALVWRPCSATSATPSPTRRRTARRAGGPGGRPPSRCAWSPGTRSSPGCSRAVTTCGRSPGRRAWSTTSSTSW